MKRVDTSGQHPDVPDARYTNRRDTEHAIDRVTVCSDATVLRITEVMERQQYRKRNWWDIREDQKRDRSKVTLPTVKFPQG